MGFIALCNSFKHIDFLFYYVTNLWRVSSVISPFDRNDKLLGKLWDTIKSETPFFTHTKTMFLCV